MADGYEKGDRNRSENGSENGSDDTFDLARFMVAQEGTYTDALTELRGGRKRTHWMWFIFPQVAGLGLSQMSQHYAIRSLEEARAYLDHPVLGTRLRECAEVVLTVDDRSASQIFGSPDDVKLRSSMTLFVCATGPDSVFERVLEKYFGGEQDAETLRLLEQTAT